MRHSKGRKRLIRQWEVKTRQERRRGPMKTGSEGGSIVRTERDYNVKQKCLKWSEERGKSH